MAKSKRELSQGQIERVSEIFGNISVAWFTLGVIAPLLTRNKSGIEIISDVGVSLLVAYGFGLFSVRLMEDTK